MPKTCVITFVSVSHAFRAETILQQQGIAARLIPVPRSLSGCCEGLAAAIPPNEAGAAVKLLQEHGVGMLIQGESVEL
ncbi:DUF3343 domain-containing protein [Acetonema longum]|uniref:Putative Se/S carrier protein-like domain-containing protein n=1 Tax=Acetonema longum DSM 6540 TaxID=1009370 RepID=F7NEW6_9FIRM|nr:DUF3343 domain-containing protein [Acetonema longum]EGO65527.1 hypothetical protein ALO_02916 [Acetonema longum DSM 6540]